MLRQFYLLVALTSAAKSFATGHTISQCLSSTDKYPCETNGSFYCPPPSYYSAIESTCKCASTENDILQCNSNGQVYVLESYCATFSESENMTEFGRCYYNSLLFGNTNYHSLPFDRTEWNEVTCRNFKRTGTLCGGCEDNHTILAYSFDLSCVKCTTGKLLVWLYIFAAFLPMTLFYILVMLFNCNISSSRYHGFVLFSQVIASPMHLRTAYMYAKKSPNLFRVVQFVGTVMGIWNLDFFRLYVHGFCLHTSSLTTVALDLIVALYPLLLVFATFFFSNLNLKPLVGVWKPVHELFNRNWRFKTSMVDSIATFLVLSNTKFLIVSFDLLAPVKTYRFITPTTLKWFGGFYMTLLQCIWVRTTFLMQHWHC